MTARLQDASARIGLRYSVGHRLGDVGLDPDEWGRFTVNAGAGAGGVEGEDIVVMGFQPRLSKAGAFIYPRPPNTDTEATMTLRSALPAIAAALAVALGASVISKPALAWDCQEDVDDLRKKIKDDDNKDRWSKKQREDALEHLRKAERHKVNPVECREEVVKARKELGLPDIVD